ncbi:MULTISPECIES: restriction endonuclease subunit S [Stenotrophomonas]|uniref:Restriction endonuclease subunit S n=1 Tax=Stenotrophomonas maltophilia TaxID=40324 RepID=A0A431ULI7_STEMA|nr:restriction endonuclease subunit S [Stenotrophomonas maltophilia]RTQ90706.1 restriction endonuclease subunit S [Stenotrophomonas maltophilia]
MECWHFKPFEECLEPVVYTTKVQRKEFLADGTYPIVSQEDGLVNGFWNNAADLFRLDHPVVVFGDHTRTLKFIDFDFVLGADGVKVLKPKPFLHPRYFYYQLHTAKLDSLGYARHYRLLKEHLVSYPALSEQRRIVAILDGAFEAIATAKVNTEKSLLNAREVFESKLYALLSHDVAAWPKKSLREVALDFGRGKSKHRPRNDPKLYGGPYPFIQTGDVRGAEHLITEYTQSYSEVGLTQSKLWPKGTLCITIAANIAETGVLNFDACFPDSIIGVVVDERQTSSKYLEYMLQTVKARLKAKGKGSAQDNINLATFEDERFPFPDLDTQARVVSLLDNLSSRVQEFEELCSLKLIALDELKRSLLHQAFSGLLTGKSTDQQLEAVP